MLLFNTVILGFGFDREGLEVVYAITLVTYDASGRDTRISVSISKKNKSGNVTHKGICQVIKMTFVFVVWRATKSWTSLWHYTALWRDGMDSITLISFPFDCQCNMQVDRIGRLRHICFVLFLYCWVEIHYIIIQFVGWDEKTWYAVIMLRFQALLSLW